MIKSLFNPASVFSRIVSLMTFGTKIKPVIKIAKIFASFIGKVDTFRSSFNFSTKFTSIPTRFFASYPSMQSYISYFIPHPIHILTTQHPNIYSSSYPRFMAQPSLVTNKTFRNFSFTFKRLFEKLFTPDKVAFMATIFTYLTFVWIDKVCNVTGLAGSWDILGGHLEYFTLLPLIGQATLTVYPDAGSGATTVDGIAFKVTANPGLTWANTLSAVADSTDVTNGTWDNYDIQASTTSNQFRYLTRGKMTFDTSALTAGATISAATVSVYGNGKADGLSATPDMNIYSATGDANNVTTGDFQTLGTTVYCDTAMTYASWSITAYNDWTLNATGRAAISLTSITFFGFRNANYDVAAVQPAWVSDGRSYLNGWSADDAGTTRDPKLVVTYTVATGQGWGFGNQGRW